MNVFCFYGKKHSFKKVLFIKNTVSLEFGDDNSDRSMFLIGHYYQQYTI